MPVTLSTWLAIILGSLFMVPLYFLLGYYRKTRVFDYLLLSGLFIGVIISNYGMAIAELLGVMDLPQGAVPFVLTTVTVDFFFVLSFVLLMFHALRIRWDRLPRPILLVFSLWSLFWIFVLCLGDILYNNSIIALWLYLYFRAFTQLNTALVCVIFILIYLTTEQLVTSDRRISAARKLWALSAVPLTFRAIVQVINDLGYLVFLSEWPIPPESVQIKLLKDLLALLGVLLIAGTSILYPESLVFSKAQLIRALNLYESVRSLEPGKQVKEFGIASLVGYLRGIPPEMLEEQQEALNRE